MCGVGDPEFQGLIKAPAAHLGAKHLLPVPESAPKHLFTCIYNPGCQVQATNKIICSHCTMGSWDCYCAICGGTFGGGQVAAQPRTARFLRHHRNQDTDHNETEAEEEANEEEEDDADGVPGSVDSWEEDHSYDPEIISEEDIEWTNTLHILGFNADAQGLTK